MSGICPNISIYNRGGGGCIFNMSICRKTQNRVNLWLKRRIFMSKTHLFLCFFVLGNAPIHPIFPLCSTSQEGLRQGGICVLSVSWFRTILYHTLCHSAIPSFCHSAIPPFCHSAIPTFRHSAIPPFCHSAILPFCHSAIPPFHHSTPIWNNAMYVSQEVLRKAVMLPRGLWSNRYVPPLHAK